MAPGKHKDIFGHTWLWLLGTEGRARGGGLRAYSFMNFKGLLPKKSSCTLFSLGWVLAETAWLGQAADEGQRAFP